MCSDDELDSPPLLMAGAGGHSKVVLDAVLNRAPERQLVISDDRAAEGRMTLLGFPVIAPLLDKLTIVAGRSIHVALGSNRMRQKISLDALQLGYVLESVIHPAACVAATAFLAAGTLVAARAVIGPDARIGRGCIVNHSAIVDHDCSIGDWVHVAPGVVLGGGVVVEDGAMVGAGAIVLPGCRIGAWAVIGAGAVVIRDVVANECVMGVPAKAKGHYE